MVSGSREVLQELGSELIKLGWPRFCEAVLTDAEWTRGHGLVVDGIRHVEAQEALRGIVAPLPVYLVYISVDEETRRVRLQGRKDGEERTIHAADLHETEQQVNGTLAQAADLRIDGRLAPDAAVDEIDKWLTTAVFRHPSVGARP